jgi:hypothetical protein
MNFSKAFLLGELFESPQSLACGCGDQRLGTQVAALSPDWRRHWVSASRENVKSSPGGTTLCSLRTDQRPGSSARDAGVSLEPGRNSLGCLDSCRYLSDRETSRLRRPRPVKSFTRLADCLRKASIAPCRAGCSSPCLERLNTFRSKMSPRSRVGPDTGI